MPATTAPGNSATCSRYVSDGSIYPSFSSGVPPFIDPAISHRYSSAISPPVHPLMANNYYTEMPHRMLRTRESQTLNDTAFGPDTSSASTAILGTGLSAVHVGHITPMKHPASHSPYSDAYARGPLTAKASGTPLFPESGTIAQTQDRDRILQNPKQTALLPITSKRYSRKFKSRH